MPTSTNTIVANALAANAEPSPYDSEIQSAYRKGCASIAAGLYAKLMELKGFVSSSPKLHGQQSQQFRNWVDDVLSMELSLIGLKSAR